MSKELKRGDYAFMCHPGKPGAQFKFENGWTISIMWSSYNYCDNRTLMTIPDKEKTGCDNAEVGVFDEDNKIVGDVWSYQTADEVAILINQVANGTYKPWGHWFDDEEV